MSAQQQYLSASVTPLTPITSQDISASSQRERENLAKGWQSVIDGKLTEWARDPSTLADDGLDAPSLDTIRLARTIAESAKISGWPPPQRVSIDTERGIVFERQDDDHLVLLQVGPNDEVEILTFINARLEQRKMIR